jgi:uncharacterized repeat protein (TIGR03803 family)
LRIHDLTNFVSFGQLYEIRLSHRSVKRIFARLVGAKMLRNLQNLGIQILAAGFILALLASQGEAQVNEFQTLYAFQGGNDGANPGSATLISDKAGNLYGTTVLGGSSNCPDGCGAVFKLAPDGTLTALYDFQGGSDGAQPWGGVIADKQGNLYGTTNYGGGGNCTVASSTGCGIVFKLAPDGTETVLYAFQGEPTALFQLPV